MAENLVGSLVEQKVEETAELKAEQMVARWAGSRAVHWVEKMVYQSVESSVEWKVVS
jgi:hypothetical protein